MIRLRVKGKSLHTSVVIYKLRYSSIELYIRKMTELATGGAL